jgi:hypothetical protein
MALRMRSSQPARLRCRSSRSGSCPRLVFVANAVSRLPFTSVNRSWAPGCGRSGADDDQFPVGPVGQVVQPGGFGDPGTVPGLLVSVIRRGPRRLRDQFQVSPRRCRSG